QHVAVVLHTRHEEVAKHRLKPRMHVRLWLLDQYGLLPIADKLRDDRQQLAYPEPDVAQLYRLCEAANSNKVELEHLVALIIAVPGDLQGVGNLKAGQPLVHIDK